MLQAGTTRPYHLRTKLRAEDGKRLRDLLHRSSHNFGKEDDRWSFGTASPGLLRGWTDQQADLRRECAQRSQTVGDQLEEGEALDHQLKTLSTE
ncbi:hypothetical protein [Ktedonosporobacter rubrisoli]|uniref:hypothetical protein n=1 Tax=Ktedonosporobacter rubrisoli TaxID=2509675 RepID=UPI001F5D670C|nr:hypothetical protein [Ktedonosporobacter rubrisoli]